MNFEPAKFLEDRETWLETLKKAEKLNIHVDAYISEAIKNGELDLTHKDIYRRNQSHFWFNGRRFACAKDLFEFKFKNYSGATANPEAFKNIVLELEAGGALVRASKDEDTVEWVINPADLLGLEGKQRLSVHTKINVFYKKKEVQVDMEALGTNTEALVDMKGMKLHAVDCSKRVHLK